MLFSPVKDDKQILKPQEMWEKTILEYGFTNNTKGKRRQTYFHIQFYSHFILFDMKLISVTTKINDTLFVSNSVIQCNTHGKAKCKISHYFSKL